ncbi:MAG: hypothetical protein ACM34N_13405, partial [Ignavibacteria bacterium]
MMCLKVRIFKSIIFLLLFFIFFPFLKLSAQTNDDCLSCHSDNGLTMEKSGKEVSIFVDDKVLGSSVH